MDHFYPALAVAVFSMLLALLSTVVWNYHRKHRYLLWLAGALMWMAAAQVASVGVNVQHSWAHSVIAGCAWAAAVSGAQAMAMRFGRNIVPSVVLAWTVLIPVGLFFAQRLMASALPAHAIWAWGLAAIWWHVLPMAWHSAVRHRLERLLLLLYSAIGLMLLLSPGVPRDAGWLQYANVLVVPMVAGLLTAVMVACVLTDAGPRMRSLRDGVTGLLTRPAFEATCGPAPAQQHFTALVVCDLDHFHRVNQKFGSDVGDEVLRYFAQLLQASVREGDVVARLGGGEFGMALRHIDRADANALVDRISDSMRRHPWANRSGIGPLTASFGIVMIKEKDSLDLALHHADVLMYQAKEARIDRSVSQGAGANQRPKWLLQSQ